MSPVWVNVCVFVCFFVRPIVFACKKKTMGVCIC